MHRRFKGRALYYVLASQVAGNQLNYGGLSGEQVWRWWLRDPDGFRAYASTFE